MVWSMRGACGLGSRQVVGWAEAGCAGLGWVRAPPKRPEIRYKNSLSLLTMSAGLRLRRSLALQTEILGALDEEKSCKFHRGCASGCALSADSHRDSHQAEQDPV